ncbi:hypothetical protein [Neisseria sp. Ec49-e6-T10]|uniref:hypothetical protein n=1 Tax=Neisseria sp. Ec49-e6-T10 TaxID=3140744 RepID=UPI003EBBC5A1
MNHKPHALSIYHGLFAVLSICFIFCFWTITVLSTLFATEITIVLIKQGILYCFILFIPCIVLTGITGFLLTKNRQGKIIQTKKKRMPIIAINGLFILVPCAFYLASKAQQAQFDVLYYLIQSLELMIGAINLYLMGRSVRDGLKLSGKIKPAQIKRF